MINIEYWLSSFANAPTAERENFRAFSKNNTVMGLPSFKRFLLLSLFQL
jgi:hypothetical protein